MSDVNENALNVQQPVAQVTINMEQTTVSKNEATPKKASRRGIASARGTSRKKFSHELAKPNGLFIAHLETIRTDMVKMSEDSVSKPSFNGLEIPRLMMTFASNEDDANDRHYIDLTFFAPESTAKTIPGGAEEWRVNSILDWLKHILNVFILKGRNFTDEEIDALSLNYDDFDEFGEYSPVEPEIVINAWKRLFENFVNMMNTGNAGNPVYINNNGKSIPIWIKLLRYNKSNNRGWMPLNNGELAFNVFVGEGAIELYRANMGSSMRLNTVREAIIPMNIEKPKVPNMPQFAIAGNVPPMQQGVPVGTPVGQNMDLNAITTSQEDDLPF